jgi:hypothetical protein
MLPTSSGEVYTATDDDTGLVDLGFKTMLPGVDRWPPP